MPAPSRPVPAILALALLYALVAGAVTACELGTRDLLAAQAAAGGELPPGHAARARLANAYLGARDAVLAHWLAYLVAALAGPPLLFITLRRFSAALGRWRAEQAGMEFHQATYDLERREADLLALIARNPDPDRQVVLGVDDRGAPVYLTDRARETHVHVLGETGTGKTKSCLEPLLFQDLWRGRGVLVVDAKGAQENEESLAALAAATSRLDGLRIFTLNPRRSTHTYNPLHLVADADPQAVAERVFSSFAGDMDNPYYRDQGRMLFVKLVRALASTGQPFHMMDVAACIADREIMAHALAQASDAAARRAISGQLAELGRKVGETFTGLLAAIERYDHPALSTYDPDIVLEHEIDSAGVVGFYLPVNYYKQLARSVGLVVFQHLQQLGALRQLDRGRPQTPLYVYADEFYSFAYEAFTDAVNKLRDARISIHLAHQSLSDLEKESREFAQGIWDNTRIKIVLKQQNPELCEHLARSLGTEKGVELTVRRSADGFLNATNMLEASSKEVDQYRLHPTRIKLLRTFQAYVTEDAAFRGVNLQLLPRLPHAAPPPPRVPAVTGLELHRMWVESGHRQGASA